MKRLTVVVALVMLTITTLKAQVLKKDSVLTLSPSGLIKFAEGSLKTISDTTKAYILWSYKNVSTHGVFNSKGYFIEEIIFRGNSNISYISSTKRRFFTSFNQELTEKDFIVWDYRLITK